MNELPINCEHTAVKPLSFFKPHPRNPNTHGEAQLILFEKILQAQGWRRPVTVSIRSGFVTKGHGALLAAKRLGLTTAPVDMQPYPDEASEIADMIADNQLARMGEPDLPVLKDLLQELDTGAMDMDLTGFDAAALEEMMTAGVPDGPQGIDEAEMAITKNACPSCGFKW